MTLSDCTSLLTQTVTEAESLYHCRPRPCACLAWQQKSVPRQLAWWDQQWLALVVRIPAHTVTHRLSQCFELSGLRHYEWHRSERLAGDGRSNTSSPVGAVTSTMAGTIISAGPVNLCLTVSLRNSQPCISGETAGQPSGRYAATSSWPSLNYFRDAGKNAHLCEDKAEMDGTSRPTLATTI